MNTVPRAYQYADDDFHYVCSWCPDKEHTENIVRSLETKKEIEEMVAMREYTQKQISHVLCDVCAVDLKKNL